MKSRILYFIAIAIILTSCSTTQPMTQKIDDAASKVGNIENFQYYVSRNIVMTKKDPTEVVGKVAKSANLKVTLNKDVIQITTSTKGVLLNTSKKGAYKVYHIAFETENDNCLRFVQKKQGREERLYLDYDNPRDKTVRYGDDVYVVEWDENNLNLSRQRAKVDNWAGKISGSFKGVKDDSEDYPYLLVKMKTKIKEKENYRKASGREVIVK